MFPPSSSSGNASLDSRFCHRLKKSFRVKFILMFLLRWLACDCASLVLFSTLALIPGWAGHVITHCIGVARCASISFLPLSQTKLVDFGRSLWISVTLGCSYCDICHTSHTFNSPPTRCTRTGPYIRVFSCKQCLHVCM